MRARFLGVVLPLLVGAAVLIGLTALGRLASKGLREEERYRARFTEIRVDPPPGLSREELLSDVQYLNDFPAEFSILDEELLAKLKAAFVRNAWVESVEEVRVTPSREVHVRLRYRTPALRVRFGKEERTVDRHGVLLPRREGVGGLPLYGGKPSRPQGRTGELWGDMKLAAVAKTVAYLPSIPITVAEMDGEAVVLKTDEGGIIRWGSPPGEEKKDEPTAARKKKYLAEQEIDSQEIDLRRLSKE